METYRYHDDLSFGLKRRVAKENAEMPEKETSEVLVNPQQDCKESNLKTQIIHS